MPRSWKATFAWERWTGNGAPDNDAEWDDVCITSKDEAYGLITGRDCTCFPVAQIDEFLAFVTAIRDEVTIATTTAPEGEDG